ncbi:MAG: T9SS type A sorting domain-containing protein [Bacteroidales bacterium]|nr:T9SS type A sorting domain-containing protein [Bacteroidales bacterium]
MKKVVLLFSILFSISQLSFAEKIMQIQFKDQAIGQFTDQNISDLCPLVTWSTMNNNASITEDPQRGKVLAINYPKSQFGPFASGSQFIARMTPAKHYFLDYFVKFDKGFEFNLGGKLPGLTSGGGDYTGGVVPTNGQGWSARYMWSTNNSILYLYYIDQSSSFGDNIPTNQVFEKDRWYRMTQEIIVNDENMNNAVIRVWMNGRLVIEKTNFRLRIAPNGLIDSFYFSTFFGGNDASWAPSVDCKTYFDDIVVSTDAPTYLKELKGATGLTNLDPAVTPRIANINKQWGSKFGDASVCLWKDDKVAAFTISIDDNIETEVDYWKTTLANYKLPVTWFLITDGQTWPDFDVVATNPNVKDWNKYLTAIKQGHCIGGHDDRNWYNTPTTPPNPDSLRYVTRLKSTRQKIDAELDSYGNQALTYAWPYGEGNANYGRTQFIAMRGTYGVLNQVDKVNYLNVNSVSSPAVVAALPTYIDPLLDKGAKLYNVTYYRGWGSTHFHALGTADAKTKAEGLLQYLKAREDSLWVGGFTPVAQYAQSRDTHHLTSSVVSSTQVKFTVTDDMNDDLFYFPLTVKIRVGNDWATATAVQNGQSVATKLIDFAGGKYLLVDAVPDRGEVLVTGVLDNDPAVFNPIPDTEVNVNEPKDIIVEAHTTQNQPLTFTSGTLPSFVTFSTTGQYTGKFTVAPAKENLGKYTITVLANNGVSTISKSFILTISPDVNTFTLIATKADAGAYFPIHTFVDPNTRDNVIAGGGYELDKQLSAVFPFQLPVIPQGKMVKEASFQVYLEGFNTPASITGVINLFALTPRSSDAVILADGYAGAFDATNGTPIQENFASKTTAIGVVKTTATGISELSKNIQNAYTDGNAGKYIFLRLSTSDVAQTKFARTMFTTSDGAAKTSDNNRYPTLFIQLQNDTLSPISLVNQSVKPRIYPNPLLGSFLQIDFPDYFVDEPISVEIYDTKGLLVNNRIINNQKTIQLDLSAFSRQIYIVKCSTKRWSTTQQIIRL